MKAALAAALALALPGPAAAAGTTGYRILLTSDRDGTSRWYSVRPDGSGLAPLLPPGSALRPVTVSEDGGTIAYRGPKQGLYVSRASGAGMRLVVRRPSDGGLVLSRDGGQLLFSNGKGLFATGTRGGRLRRVVRGAGTSPDDISLDAKAVVYDREWEDREGNDRSEVVLRPLHGKPRVLGRSNPDVEDDWVGGWGWTPDGRWLAYFRGDSNGYVLWFVRPDGAQRHRVPGDVHSLDWSPDGKRLVVTDGDSILLADAAGRRPKRLHVKGLELVDDVAWAADGSHLVLGAHETSPYYAPAEIWTVGLDGAGLRRLTSRGANGLVAVTRLEPVQPQAAPVTPAERVVAADTVATTAPVAALSADGGSVAFVTKERRTDCDHVAVWTPADGSLRRFGALPAPCTLPIPVDEVALAGSRVAWTRDTGSSCDIALDTATFAAPLPVGVGISACMPSSYHVHGDGDLLVFDSEVGLMRIGGTEPCDPHFDTGGICATLRRGDHTSPVESVSGGLIAIREPGAVSVLDARGQLVRVLAFAPDDVTAARLDGGRLVVWRFGVLEEYDVATGALLLSRPLPTGYRLVDVDGGIAVLTTAGGVQLLRLDDGRSLTLPGSDPTLADLEPPGLYYSYATADGGGRVVFVPRAEILRRLG